MGEDALPPITADALRLRDEWRQGFPGAAVVWEETSDEGVGHGFDGLDPSAMMRALCRTSSTWPEVLVWYQGLLAGNGWLGKVVKGDYWWEWTAPERPGEQFVLMDRSHVPDNLKPWAPPQDSLLFEIMLTARTLPDEGAPSA